LVIEEESPAGFCSAIVARTSIDTWGGTGKKSLYCLPESKIISRETSATSAHFGDVSINREESRHIGPPRFRVDGEIPAGAKIRCVRLLPILVNLTGLLSIGQTWAVVHIQDTSGTGWSKDLQERKSCSCSGSNLKEETAKPPQYTHTARAQKRIQKAKKPVNDWL